MKNLQNIEEDFDKLIETLPSRVGETPKEVVKQFYRSQFLEMLESLRMERYGACPTNNCGHDKDRLEPNSVNHGYYLGYSEAISEFNRKLDALRGEGEV